MRMNSSSSPWVVVGGYLLVLGACTEGAQWREMRPEGLNLAVSMPCQPHRSTRTVALAGERVDMTLLVCSYNDATFAVVSARMTEPRNVGAALQELVQTARTNIGGRVVSADRARVPGMTPNDGAVSQDIVGRSPEGNAIEMQIEVFAYGLKVLQVTYIGPRQEASTAKGLFDGLRVIP